MEEKTRAFDQALSNFTFGVANRDLICHMAAEGYSVRQIKEATDYPVSEDKIRETVWEYYLETGLIRLNPPDAGDEPRYEYVMDIGRFGKRSFRRVEMKCDSEPAQSGEEKDHYQPDGRFSESPNKEASYIPCDFGILRATDAERFQSILDALDSRKRDYIEGLPWPPQIVYHIDNLAMREIRDILVEKGLWNV